MSMKSPLASALALFSLLLFAAAGCESPAPLAEKDVLAYIRAHRNLQRMAPELIKEFRKPGKLDLAESQKGLSQANQAIKDAGFDDYAHFSRVNSRIAKDFGKMRTKRSQESRDDSHSIGAQRIEAALNNPNVPASTKRELRAKLKKRDKRPDEDSRWAALSRRFDDAGLDPKTQRVLKRHEGELTKIFTGKFVRGTKIGKRK